MFLNSWPGANGPAVNWGDDIVCGFRWTSTLLEVEQLQCEVFRSEFNRQQQVSCNNDINKDKNLSNTLHKAGGTPPAVSRAQWFCVCHKIVKKWSEEILRQLRPERSEDLLGGFWWSHVGLSDPSGHIWQTQSVTTKIIIIIKKQEEEELLSAGQQNECGRGRQIASVHSHTVNIVRRGTRWWHASIFTHRSVCAGYVTLISYRFYLSCNIKNQIFTRPSWKTSPHIDSHAPRRRFISAETFICIKYFTVNEVFFPLQLTDETFSLWMNWGDSWKSDFICVYLLTLEPQIIDFFSSG